MTARVTGALIASCLAAACSGGGDPVQPATERGAMDAAVSYSEAALSGDVDGLWTALSDECRAGTDRSEIALGLLLIRGFFDELDIDGIEARAEIESFTPESAEIVVSFTDGEGNEIGDQLFLSADTVELVYEGSRWVTETCEFDGGSDGISSCLTADGTLSDCPEVDPATTDRDDPVPVGRPAYIGEGYMMRLTELELDATATIRREVDFASDLEGLQPVLIGIELSFIGDEGPSNPFLDIGGVGSSGVAVDDFSCGSIPDEIQLFGEVFTGGVLRGNVCLAAPPDQIDSLVLFTDVGFTDTKVFFALQGDQVEGAVPSVRGPVPGAAGTDQRVSPEPADTLVEIGDWEVKVVDLIPDATGRVTGASEFNDPPPDGMVYTLVEYEATYRGEDSASVFEVMPDLVGDANVAYDDQCLVSLEGQLETFDVVFTDGTVSGLICYVVPADEVDSLVGFVGSNLADHDLVTLALS